MDAATEDDDKLLAQYAWNAYASMPATFKPQVESCLFMQVVAQSPKTLNQDYSHWQACATLLSTNSSLRSLFLVCWEVGSFEKIRKIDILQAERSTALNAPTTIIHYGSTFTEVHGDSYSYSESNERRRKKITKWFSAFDYGPIQKDTYSRRAEETGNWFIESPVFDGWLKNKGKRILWCPGMPGVGKTVISSLVVHHLEELRKTPVCVTYLNYKRRSQQSLSHILSTMLRQLYELFEPAMDLIEDFYKFHSVRSHPTVTDLMNVVIAASGTTDHIYLILDGLDEYLEYYSDDAIVILRDALMSIPNLKLMVTSRVIGSMKRIFEGDQVVEQEIHTSEADLKRYLDHRISTEIPKKFHEPLKGKIMEHVMTSVKQRFLMAKLHMDLVASRLTLGEMRDALNALSEEVDQVYRQAIERINQQGDRQRNLAHSVLMWVACTHRNLTVKELQHALAVAPGRKDIEDYLYSEEVLTSICAGLVVINEHLGLVQFVHHTTQEFFERTRSEYFPDADSQILASCSFYLDIHPSSYDKPPSNVFTLLDYLPFYRYMVEHLCRHLRDSGQSFIDSTKDSLGPGVGLLTTIVCAKGHHPLVMWRWLDWKAVHFAAAMDLVPFLKDVVAYNEEKIHSREKQTGFTPIICSVRVAAINAIRYLFGLGIVDVNDRDLEGNSLLAIASRHGHKDIVDLLLSTDGVDINSRNKIGRTPLHEAVMYDKLDVFRILLSNPEIHVNAQDKSFETPLFLAVRYRQEEMTGTLLQDSRVDFSLINDHGQTPLALAVAEGTETMVNLLLQADTLAMEFRDKEGRTHLSWAASNGMTEIVETILNIPNCPVDLADEAGRTPLSYACDHGHIEVVRILLAIPQIDPDSKDSENYTPLYFAARSGHLPVADALLATRRVDPDHATNEGRTPLSISSNYGKTPVVQRLLREFVNVNCRDKTGRTPLSYAAHWGQEFVVKLLLHAGALVDQRDNAGRTPLHHVATWHKELVEIMKILLDARADIEAADNHGLTPLMAVITSSFAYGHHRMLQFLLNHGANAEVRDDCGRDPLCYAAGQWWSEFTVALIPHVSSVNTSDDSGWTPLIHAANRGSFLGIEVLIKNGADIHRRDLVGRTALHYAVAEGLFDPKNNSRSGNYLRKVTVLLDAGADFNSEDNDGRKPLDYARSSDTALLLVERGGVRSELPPLEHWKWVKI